MVLSRVGGLLLIAGTVLVGIWWITFRAPAGPEEVGGDGLIVSAITVLLGAGAGAVAVAAASPLEAWQSRIGLGLLSIGLIGVAIGRTVVVIPTGSNELASTPWILLVGGGTLTAVIGALVLGVTLVRSSSLGPRFVGLALLAGPVSVPLASAISLPLHVDASAVVLIRMGILVVGVAGAGVLALGVGRARFGTRS